MYMYQLIPKTLEEQGTKYEKLRNVLINLTQKLRKLL